MSILVAKHMRWEGLECIVLCTDSQLTISNTGTDDRKRYNQKIHPVGNCFISGVGNDDYLKIAKRLAANGMDAGEAASLFMNTLLHEFPEYSISNPRIYSEAKFMVSGPQSGGNGLGLYQISPPIEPGGSLIPKPQDALVLGTLQETQQGLAEKKPWDISSLLLDVHRIAIEAAASIYVNDSFQYAILTRTSEGVGAHALFPPKVQVGSIELLDASERVHVFLGNQLVVPW